jgi:hypothetical protein
MEWVAASAEASADHFLSVRPGVHHGYANVSGAPVEILVSFRPAGLEALFPKCRPDSEKRGRASWLKQRGCTVRNSRQADGRGDRRGGVFIKAPDLDA